MTAVSFFEGGRKGGRREQSAHGVDDISLSVVNDALDDRRRREWPSVLKVRATKAAYQSSALKEGAPSAQKTYLVPKATSPSPDGLLNDDKSVPQRVLLDVNLRQLCLDAHRARVHLILLHPSLHDPRRGSR